MNYTKSQILSELIEAKQLIVDSLRGSVSIEELETRLDADGPLASRCASLIDNYVFAYHTPAQQKQSHMRGLVPLHANAFVGELVEYEYAEDWSDAHTDAVRNVIDYEAMCYTESLMQGDQAPRDSFALHYGYSAETLHRTMIPVQYRAYIPYPLTVEAYTHAPFVNGEPNAMYTTMCRYGELESGSILDNEIARSIANSEQCEVRDCEVDGYRYLLIPLGPTHSISTLTEHLQFPEDIGKTALIDTRLTNNRPPHGPMFLAAPITYEGIDVTQAKPAHITVMDHGYLDNIYNEHPYQIAEVNEINAREESKFKVSSFDISLSDDDLNFAKTTFYGVPYNT